MAYGEITRLCSNSRSDEYKLYRYPPEKLEKHHPDVFGLFLRQSHKNIMGMEDFYSDVKHETWSKPLLGNSMLPMMEIPKESVDIVVSSPPYGDSRTTVAYGQFSRFAMRWLGMEETRDLDGLMLGGKRQNTLESGLGSLGLEETIELISTQDKGRAGEVLAFYKDFDSCLGQITTYLKPGAYVCFVVGNRKVKGVRIPTDFITIELAKKYGLEAVKVIIRNIPSKRMPLRNSPTNVVGVFG